MYLVDTNVWLERLLSQERSDEVGSFLARAPGHELLITDFYLHSIGVILDRLDRIEALRRFVDDLFVRGGVRLVSVSPESMGALIDEMDRSQLDFDDAYQYVAAAEAGALIVSFDHDFDRTSLGRLEPNQALASMARSAS
ncbi:MAG TPA: PIN domain-containing protein [Anaerolineae bacterium]|nr:PIN domain-containing protein [Anaerolineae bacterium]